MIAETTDSNYFTDKSNHRINEWLHLCNVDGMAPLQMLVMKACDPVDAITAILSRNMVVSFLIHWLDTLRLA